MVVICIGYHGCLVEKKRKQDKSKMKVSEAKKRGQKRDHSLNKRMEVRNSMAYTEGHKLV